MWGQVGAALEGWKNCVLGTGFPLCEPLHLCWRGRRTSRGLTPCATFAEAPTGPVLLRLEVVQQF